MRKYYSTTLEINNISQEKYDLLIEFLEDKDINYETTDFDEFTIDERSEEEKYDEWLWTLADNHIDENGVE